MRPSGNSGVILDRHGEKMTLCYAMPLVGVEDEQRARIIQELDASFPGTLVSGEDGSAIIDTLTDMAALNAADTKASLPTRLRYDGFAIVDPLLGRNLLRCSNRAVRMLVQYNKHPETAHSDPGRHRELAEFLSSVAVRRNITKSRWQNLR